MSKSKKIEEFTRLIDKQLEFYERKSKGEKLDEISPIYAIYALPYAIKAAMSVYKQVFDRAHKACKGLEGVNYNICKNQAQLKALQAQAAKLSGETSKCAKAKNPEECKQKLQNKIAQIKNKMQIVSKTLAGLKQRQTRGESVDLYLNMIQEAEGMEGLPKGWTQKSVKKFAKSLAGKGAAEKGFFDKCVDKMKDKVDDPQAFCAAVKDEVEGSTYWRGKGKSEEEAERETARKQNVKQD